MLLLIKALALLALAPLRMVRSWVLFSMSEMVTLSLWRTSQGNLRSYMLPRTPGVRMG
jgi:hypothetical protein